MVHILIDTCSWIQLVSKSEISKELKQIKLWVDSGEISVFYPETLKDEWEKHREEEIKKISNSVRTQETQDKLFRRPVSKSQVHWAKELLASQIEDIDNILKTSELINISDRVKVT